MIKEILGEYINNYNELFLISDYDNSLDNNNIQIYHAYNKENECECCLKVINKEKLKLGDYDFLLEQIKKEEEIAQLCKSDYILNLNKKFETENYIIFEYEYCEYNLLDYIYENGEFINEKEYFKEIILNIGKALKILYENGIIHRNIRPNNIFIKSLDDNEKIKSIKIGNFDCSIYKKDNKSEPIGNIHYAAPEIIKNLEYDEKCDLWSLGITLYELYFGILPFYNLGDSIYIYECTEITNNYIIEKINDEKNFIYKKSKIPTLDILFKRLLTINPKERMTYDEFFEYIFNDNFMKKDVICLNNNKIYKEVYDIILKEPIIERTFRTCPPYEEIIIRNLKKLGHLFEYNFPNIININNNYKLENKYNNIIYYDENSNLISIYKECDEFEIILNQGSFIFCRNIESLNLIKEEIIRKNKKDRRIIFNIIVTGSKCEKILNFLQENQQFKNCIKNISIYCMNKNNYLSLKEKYEIIEDIHIHKSTIFKYINDSSSQEIKNYPLIKIITYENYLKKYKDIHFKISQFYGNLTKEEFEKYLKEMKLSSKLIYEFRFDDNFEKIDSLISKQYLKNTFYDELDKIDILYNSNDDSFKYFLYYTSRIKYFLDNYAKENNKYYKENKKILYKGDKLYYSSLIKYERIKGKIILFPTFTTVYENENLANIYSGRNNSKELYKNSLKFSVIFIITNLFQNNWISNIINLNNEKKLLFQPFSFFRIKDVKINLNNFTADIYLETIGKVEILEEKIRLGKSIKYNEKENIMEIEK